MDIPGKNKFMYGWHQDSKVILKDQNLFNFGCQWSEILIKK